VIGPNSQLIIGGITWLMLALIVRWNLELMDS